MENHLIIGLGGTGGKVIRELRKRIYETFKSNHPEHGLYIDYLYVDTEGDLNDRKGWDISGQDVLLNDCQKVRIDGTDPTLIENIEYYTPIQALLNEEDMAAIKGMEDLLKGGYTGQRRRLGRLLLANNLSHPNIANFETKVKNAVNRLHEKSHEINVTFHICSGLAGGLGSGALIDTIALIRTWYPFVSGRPAWFKIQLLLHVPEQVMLRPQYDAGFYQANGYAVLSELAAMSVGNYFPIDITGNSLTSPLGADRLLTTQKPFEGCYLYNSFNEDGTMTDFNTLPECAAEFLYQSLFDMVNTRQLESPDFDFGHETDKNGKYIHTSQIFNLSFKPLEQPDNNTEKQEEEPPKEEKEETPIGYGFFEEIQLPQTRAALLLDNRHLMLAEPIIPKSSIQWKDFDLSWKEFIEWHAKDIQVITDKKQWIQALDECCKDYFDKDFRKYGVKPFYDEQLREVYYYADHIVNQIEHKLTDDGAKSKAEVRKYMELLRIDCSDRISKFEERKAYLSNDELPKFIEEAKAIRYEYDSIGTLKDLFSKASKKLFEQYQEVLCDQYVTETYIESFDFAKELLQRVIIKLSDLEEQMLYDENKEKEEACRNKKCEKVTIIAKYEISIKQNPLRKLACLPVLKEKYDTLVNAPNGKLNRMMLHTESFEEELPPLLYLE